MHVIPHALTLWQPWAWALFHGKPVENRNWAPPKYMVGRRLVIHAGKTYDREGDEFVRRQLGLGILPEAARWQGVVGTVTIDRIIHAGAVGQPADPMDDSPWFFGRVGWVLRDQLELQKPIPCRGRQGLWPLPPNVLAQLVGVW